MSARHYNNAPPYHDQRSHAPQHRNERNRRSYEDQRLYSTDRYRRSPSPRDHYPTSPHDWVRDSHGDNDFEIKGASTRRERSLRDTHGGTRDRDDYKRRPSPSPRGRDRGYYRDRDREGYRSPSYDSRDRSRSRSRSRRRNRSPYYGGPPSREVMVEGLMPDMVEEDISKELKQHHNVEKLDDVRIIRDRQTKVSRGFGFLRFSTLEESKAFVEQNYPTIYLYGHNSSDNDDQAAKIRIAYSRERDDRSRGEKAEGEWTCKITPQIDMTTFGPTVTKAQYMNSGDSDVSPDGQPSQFLLIRGLEPTVTEDLLAKGVAKLYKPSRRPSEPVVAITKKGNAKVASTTGDANLGAREGSLRRVLLVKDRRNNESWRYGFAEFATIDDAQAALTRYNSFEKFTISSKPVTADYIHAGVFVPVFNMTDDTERFLITPLGNPATKLRYWDEEAWVSELVVASGSPGVAPVSNETQPRSAADQAAAAAENEGLVKPGSEAEAKVKKRKAEAGAIAKQKKTAPAHLQFWSSRHAELHGVKTDTTSENEGEGKVPPEKQSGAKEFDTPSQSYADLSKKCCYLCSRQFKTEAEVNKHERLSDLHRDNLNNAELVTKANQKMAKAGVTPRNLAEDSSEYRDRAKERRQAFGASKRVSLPLKKTAAQPEEEAQDEPAPAPSKGASLLGKMGWSAGEGLGAQGTGMTAPIAQDMYVQGVGLGAQGGKIGDAEKEAERNTRGSYGEFLERTKDKAKERFESMH